jgi:hypothetical protein
MTLIPREPTDNRIAELNRILSMCPEDEPTSRNIPTKCKCGHLCRSVRDAIAHCRTETRRSRLTGAQKDLIREMLASGKIYAQISRETGIPQLTVSRVARGRGRRTAPQTGPTSLPGVEST